MVSGVLSGFGHYFGIDPTWLRIIFAVGSFFSAIIPGAIVYLLLVMIMPSDDSLTGSGVE